MRISNCKKSEFLSKSIDLDVYYYKKYSYYICRSHKIAMNFILSINYV